MASRAADSDDEMSKAVSDNNKRPGEKEKSLSDDNNESKFDNSTFVEREQDDKDYRTFSSSFDRSASQSDHAGPSNRLGSKLKKKRILNPNSQRGSVSPQNVDEEGPNSVTVSFAGLPPRRSESNSSLGRINNQFSRFGTTSVGQQSFEQSYTPQVMNSS